MFFADAARNRCRVHQLDFNEEHVWNDLFWRKDWYLDLKDWLNDEGFTQLRGSPYFFCKVFPYGLHIKLIVCVDDNQDADFNISLDQA
jgi:hypothetical protein